MRSWESRSAELSTSRERTKSGSSLGAVLLKQFPSIPGDSEGPSPGRVIVVGAGAAGLSAARILKEAGIEVLVLEGRDRIGGRIWTVNVDGCAIDLNGGYLHDSDINPLVRVYQDLKWRHRQANFIDMHANAYDAQTATSLGILAKIRLAYHMQQYFRGPKRKPLSEEEDYAVEAWTRQYLQETGLSGPEGRLVESIIRSAQSTDGSDLSMRWYRKLPVRGDDKVIVPLDGFGALVEAMAEGLDVRLQHAVSRISVKETGLEVACGQELFSASHVIVTVPIGVLSGGDIRFEPPLSDDKRTAIRNIGFARMEKLVFFLSDPLPDDFTSRIYFDSTTGCRLTFQNQSARYGRPLVTAYAHTDFIAQFAKMEPEERSNLALAALSRILGTSPLVTQRTLQSDWTNSPFSRGAYSYIKVHQGPECIDLLAQPEYAGRLLFAGEASDRDRHAHVEGAVASGVREARRLIH